MSMLSTRNFLRIESAYLNTCCAEKTSRYLYSGRAGQRSFAGGIFDAAYSRCPPFFCMMSPSISSLLPSPYAHAVSKKLQPRSTAICIEASDSRSSEPVHPLMPQRPSPISLTSKFVFPSLRYFMIASSELLLVAPRPVFKSSVLLSDIQIVMQIFNSWHQNYCNPEQL